MSFFENLVEKMTSYAGTIHVIDYNNWNKTTNSFELEHYYDVANKFIYSYDLSVKNGKSEKANVTKYVDVQNQKEYSKFGGWSDWSEDTNYDEFEDFLTLDLIDHYDYIKKGNVLYGRLNEYGSHLIVEIHLNDKGLIDNYISYAADDDWNKKADAVEYKTTFSYDTNAVSIPADVIETAKNNKH